MTATAAVATAGSTAATSGAPGALGSLSNNFNDFLKLLMAQLQNQDPSSPTDPNAFTQQLVQFSQVEQQVNTNSNLTSLIQLTQGSALMQSSSLVGKTVEAQTDKLSLQNGTAGLQFAASAPATVNVGVYNSAGIKVRDATVDTTANKGAWTWDGTDNNGRTLPDGAYSAKATDAAGSGTTVQFGITGKVTGLVRSGNDLTLQMGSVPMSLSTVQSVGN